MKFVVVGIIPRLRDSSETEFLLVSSVRENFKENSGAFYPPGGHVEQDETPEEALVREIKEELSLVIKPIRRVAVTGADVQDQQTIWYLCAKTVADAALVVNKNEINKAGWFTLDEMENIRLWPATKKFFEKFGYDLQLPVPLQTNQ